MAVKTPTGIYHGRRSGPPGDEAEYWMPRDFALWEKAWDAYLDATVGPGLNVDGTSGRATGSVDLGRGRGSTEVDNSPEAVAARALASQRRAEAIAYVASYRGRWGLPLDIRANPAWGTKHLKLSERQVEVLLAGKARDEQRATEAAANRHPQYDEALRLLAEARPGDFINSLRDQVSRGRTLSERQVEALLRGANRGHVEATQAAGLAAQPATGQAVAGPLTEGYYMVGDRPWRAVISQRSGHLYAMDLDDTGKWRFVSGGLRTVATGRPMTLEEASAFGKLYGRCMVCGATLTDPESIAAGIGPICAGRWA